MKIFLILAVLLGLSGSASAVSPEYTLIASAFCTKKGCPPEDPCCNNCEFDGWFDREFNVKAVSRDPGSPLPMCVPDGCGACPFMLQAKGEPDNIEKPQKFYVSEWVKVDNSLAYHGPKQEDLETLPAPQVSEEERKKAVEDWMKDLKTQSDANMEKLKKEDPQQYQKIEQFLKMLQSAAPAGSPSPSGQEK